MCIKINKVGKQEVGIWWVQKRLPRYGVPIWSLWPNIRFLPSTVTEKNVTKNILDGWKDGQTDRGKSVYTPPPSGSGVIIICMHGSVDKIAQIHKHKQVNEKIILTPLRIYLLCITTTCMLLCWSKWFIIYLHI